MSCDKALRVVTDDGEELLECMAPYHVERALAQHRDGDGTFWADDNPAQVAVRPVEPEQPTVRKVAGELLAAKDISWCSAADVLVDAVEAGLLAADVAGEQPREREGTDVTPESDEWFVRHLMAGEQPLDVEAWKRQAVEVARQAFDKWGRARDDDPRKAHVAVVDALIEAGLAGGAERPPPFDKDEAVEWLVRRTTRVNDGVHAHTGRLHERDARRIVEHFSRLAYPQAPTERGK